jgi:hypothetical protein
MPRDGSGIYSTPVGTNGVPDATIASTPYNINVHDVEQDLNTPRPIVAGGTGAVNAAQARDNLDAEVSMQVVTNYDTHVWEAGSFKSAIGVNGAPTATENFSGICHMFDNTSVFLEARAYEATQQRYVRRKYAGSWFPWELNEQASINLANTKVAKAGDIMTGALTISSPTSLFVLSKSTSGQNLIYGRTGVSDRWIMELGNANAETGGDTGSNFALNRASDAGVVSQALLINRASGAATFFGVLTAVGTVAGSNPGIGNTNTGFSIDKNANGPFIAASRSDNSLAHWNINIDGVVHYMLRSGAPVGSISVSTTATAYNTSSGAELKEDLREFDASRIIDATNVYDFAWKSTKERAYGVLAQQAKDVYPAAVTYDEGKDWWGIDYSRYVPVLLNELKALRARVAQLEAGMAEKPA